MNDQQQNTLAVIFAPVASRYPHVCDALRLAGWDEADGADSAAAVLIIADGQGDRPLSHCGQLVAAVIEAGSLPRFPADLILDPSPGVDSVAERLRLWRIPAVDPLVRMADMFGRDGLAPVVEGLRTDLARALVGEAVDAHRIAGLAGTLGFIAASASWRAMDEGVGDQADALRDSRTTLIAIDGWMRASP